MSELKPCPFCGSNDLREESSGLIEAYKHYQHCYIECISCGCEAGHVDLEGDYQEVMEKWNNRSLEDKLEAELNAAKAEIEQLRNVIKDYRNGI